MLAHTLIIALTSLATVSLGATLPVAKTNGNANAARSTLDPVLDVSVDSAGVIESRNVSALAVVDPAVRFTSYTERACGGDASFWRATDGGCFHLSGEGLGIREIADTCRVFAYATDSCTGTEFQAYIGNCYDIRNFYGMKVFCH